MVSSITGGLMFSVVISLIGYSSSQMPSNYLTKVGACPPLLTRQVCWDSCQEDQECPGEQRCCGTTCGGRVCSRAVTPRRNPRIIKSGMCPVVPEGPWFCSNTCTSDGDCRETKKCCRNKCGALACYLPLTQDRI